jgi:DNA-binding IclR family transcriptional regulator
MKAIEAGNGTRSSDDSLNNDSRTLWRGLVVLECVAKADHKGVRIAEICRRCGLERATVYRLLSTLIEFGYVTKCDRYLYVAGVTLDRITIPAAGPAAILAPLVATVSERTRDTAFAIVRDGDHARCVARHAGPHVVQAVDTGTRQPMGVGAAGLALLAALPDEEANSVIDSYGHELSRYGGMTADRLRMLVEATKQRGWSVVGNHAVAGVLGVGIAVCDAHRRPVAAISVASAVERMPQQRQTLVAHLMHEALLEKFPHGVERAFR